MFLSIISFIFAFTLVAISHEFGHFYAAKKSGIFVDEFGIGFGPTLFSFKKGETKYSLNLIPILAYVKIAGESNEEEIDCPEEKKFYSKPLLNRFLVAFTGPFMNIVLAFLILTAIFLFVGVPKEAFQTPLPRKSAFCQEIKYSQLMGFPPQIWTNPLNISIKTPISRLSLK
ncbi:MAG: regulator of sigma E protease [Candidatus Saganbacteria bacterium]|uniref:Regulator of sigma E protease n=1 Tax=Candidatus Saganbacteria bacterium TaxID=2575572 RepID=A0A833L0U7_UNCSA|nr:MAG: regulator of sigma E protease [Candidatus Saganbacteria bacterium]